MKNINIYVTLVFLISGCVDEFDLDSGHETPRLVIEGQITTAPGPYTVKITQSRKFSSADGTGFVPVKDAVVEISDNEGNKETLIPSGEDLDLVYKTSTNGIKGEVGKSYTLTVTIDSDTYQSIPQKIEPAGDILDIAAVYKTEGIPEYGDYFDVLVDAEDNPDQRRYYRWDWTGTYEIHAEWWRYCQTHCCVEGCPNFQILHLLYPDCCSVCWVNTFSETVAIADSYMVDIDGFSIAKVDVNDFTFYVKYHMKVNQYSISKDAYEFWGSAKKQIENSGSIFDSAPSSTKGNIYHITDNTKRVLGVFSASDVVSREFFFDNDQITRQLSKPEWFDDCRKIKYSTTEMPEFWN